MEVNFSEIKRKDVINLTDGKHLGKTCDLALIFPEGKILGITVTGSKGFKFSKQNIFIPLGCISKIGEDAILVSVTEDNGDGQEQKRREPRPEPYKVSRGDAPSSRRSFDEYE